MITKCLTPRVKQTDKTNLAAEVLFITAELFEHIKSGLKEYFINYFFVADAKSSKFTWQSKYYMMITKRKKLGNYL